MMPSLPEMARALGGSVRRGKTGPHIVAPGPGQKPNDRSLSAWINGDKFGLYSHRGDNWRGLDAYVRERCGLPSWRPTRRKRTPKPVSFSTRNMFFGETQAICRLRKRITFEQFGLLINDLRLRGETYGAISYAREFGFTTADLERAMAATPSHYTADERAKVFHLTYAERQQLGLRRTGSIDVDKAGRERARRDRYNAKRRAARQEARAVKALASIEVPSSQKVVGKHGYSSKGMEVTPYSKIVPEGREWCGRNKNQGRAIRWGEGGRLSGRQGHRTDHRMALADREIASGGVRYGAATVRIHPVQSRLATDNGRTPAFDAVWEIVPTMAAIKRTRQTPDRTEFYEEMPMLSNSGLKPEFGLSEMLERHRKIESDLLDQGIKLYPPTTAGERARTLWRHIKGQLLSGAAVEITASALRLDWHREELRRARMILIDMELIKPRADGRYVLGRLGPFSRIDELIRDQYLDLKLMEEVVVALSAITSIATKSKTHERPGPSSASQSPGARNKRGSLCGNDTR